MARRDYPAAPGTGARWSAGGAGCSAASRPSGGQERQEPTAMSGAPTTRARPARPSGSVRGEDRDIYVQIPAYRDAELSATLRDLYAQAARPEHLRVRVMWQRG